MPLTGDSKATLIESYKVHPTDTGSPEVQIALLSERISYLTEHFRVHQRFVILLGLPRVTDRKLGECIIKGVALAAIACNHCCVPGLGVR